MDAVEIFTRNSQSELQFDINQWLRENRSRYILKQVSYSTYPISSEYTPKEVYSAMLWYSNKRL